MYNIETILVTGQTFGILTCIRNALKKLHRDHIIIFVKFLTFGIHCVCHINIYKMLRDLNKNSFLIVFLNQ